MQRCTNEILYKAIGKINRAQKGMDLRRSVVTEIDFRLNLKFS